VKVDVDKRAIEQEKGRRTTFTRGLNLAPERNRAIY
jgi:hypothetical protein